MKSPIIVVGFVMLILLSISANANYIYSTDDFKTEVLPNWLNIYGSYTIDTSGNGYLELNGGTVKFHTNYPVFIMKSTVNSPPVNQSRTESIYMNSSVYYKISATYHHSVKQIGNKTIVIDIKILTISIEINGNNTVIAVDGKHSGGAVDINQTEIGNTIYIHAQAGAGEGNYSFDGSGINWNSTFTMKGDCSIWVDSLTVVTGGSGGGNNGGGGNTPPSNPISPLFPKIPNTPEVGGVSVVWWGVIAGTIGAVIYWVYVIKGRGK